MKVFVIHWNAPNWLAGTVASLAAAGGDVTVIDNRSDTPPSVNGARVIDAGANLGFAGAANIAIREAVAEEASLFAIACHDVTVASSALREAWGYAEANPGYGILGLEGGGMNDLAGNGWISGTFMLLRRECVEQVGAFDELFGSYVEDIDYCHRAWAAGWKVGIVPGATASSHGTSDEFLAHRLVKVNVAVLAAKERRWLDMSRCVAGMARRCVTSPRGDWWVILALTVQRLTQLGWRSLRAAYPRSIALFALSRRRCH